MSTFIAPRTTYYGLGSLENLKTIKGKKAVIVTGKGSMKKYGFLDRSIKLLKTAGIEAAVFDGVEEDPSIETVQQGVKFFVKERPDVIVGLGGCSAIDAAKVMWVFYEYPDTKFEEIIPPFTIKSLRNKAIFVAIPSTSGTGTEVTCAAVITDRSRGVKHPIVSYEITPDVAIVDGEICQTMPPHVTANTGLDALAHDTEAYVSILASNYTDCLAFRSIQMIFKTLPEAFHHSNNLEARQIMHDASCMAGMAFTNALLGIVHAMAHQLGGMFGVPHGRANAILMPNVIRYNSKDPRAAKKYAELAVNFGKTTAEDYAQEVARLSQEVGVEKNLKDYGIDEKIWLEKLDTISQNALNDACVGANPRKPSLNDLKRIFECCYAGTFVDF